MSNCQTYCHGVVGAVNLIGTIANRQSHFEIPERILGSGRYDRRQWIAVRGVFLSDRFRRIPVWVLLLRDDMGLAQRRAPIHSADAHRVGDNFALLVLPRAWMIVKAMFGEIEDDGLVRAGR